MPHVKDLFFEVGLGMNCENLVYFLGSVLMEYEWVTTLAAWNKEQTILLDIVLPVWHLILSGPALAKTDSPHTTLSIITEECKKQLSYRIL